jgi:DNA polymerase III delta prime subunit
MKISSFLNPLNTTKLISMNRYFDEMTELYNSKKFPKVLLLNGKKGLGKFTLVIHFLNYIFTKNDKNTYNLSEKKINTQSLFYNELLDQTNQDVILIKAEENKNIKIEDIRNLKSNISNSSLSKNPRFIVIDEVEFINDNSANALLKALEEPSTNNFFILINNQQADLLKTVSSRCLINNIFLTSNEIDIASNYLLKKNNTENLIGFKNNLTPGLFISFNDIYLNLDIKNEDNISIKINKLLNAYKKNKVKLLINLTL